MHYALIARCAKEWILDVNVLREGAGGKSDHFLVETSVKAGGVFSKRK